MFWGPWCFLHKWKNFSNTHHWVPHLRHSHWHWNQNLVNKLPNSNFKPRRPNHGAHQAEGETSWSWSSALMLHWGSNLGSLSGDWLQTEGLSSWRCLCFHCSEIKYLAHYYTSVWCGKHRKSSRWILPLAKLTSILHDNVKGFITIWQPVWTWWMLLDWTSHCELTTAYSNGM